jgi:hypothetical protein
LQKPRIIGGFRLGFDQALTRDAQLMDEIDGVRAHRRFEKRANMRDLPQGRVLDNLDIALELRQAENSIVRRRLILRRY